MSARSVSKFIPLETLYEIRDNQYRTSDGKSEYLCEEIDQMIWSKELKRSERDANQTIREINQG